jgi:hypothetical protein
MKPRIAAITLILGLGLFFAGNIAALDYGLVAGTEPEFVFQSDEGGAFTWKNSLSPWFSTPLGSKATAYLSFKTSFDRGRQEEWGWDWPPVVEPERFEITYRPSSISSLTLGRQPYRDSAGLITSGFFDGFSGSVGLGGKARLSAGVYYTGLLYKETAKILMTPNDLALYSRKLDYADWDTYFASRRLLGTIRGELPSLSPRSSLTLDLIAQVDQNTSPDRFNSQYIEALYGFELTDTVDLTTAAAGGWMEPADTEGKFSFAIRSGARWRPPTVLQDQVSAELVYASGNVNDDVGDFTSISNITVGQVFTPKIPSLLSVHGTYTVRLHETVSAEGGAAWFFRTDQAAGRSYSGQGSNSRFSPLGGEAFGSLIWAPDPDVRVTLQAGGFIGGDYFQITKVIARAGLGLVISF